MDQIELRSSGEFSDLTVQVDHQQLHLHRFPLVARCNYFRGLQRSGMSDVSLVTLDHLPGGYDTMNLVADFCYGISIDGKLTTKNIGHVICASSYLQMYGPGNLTEICQFKIRELTTNPSKCLEVLANCVDIGEIAQAEEVTKFCAETVVQYWSRLAKTSKWTIRLENASEPLLQLKNLPVNWTALIFDLMQTRKCSRPLIAYFAAGYIDYIIECFSALRRTGSCVSNDMSTYLDAACETVAMEKSSDHVEVSSFPCSLEATDDLTAAASSSSENDAVDSDIANKASASSSTNNTINIHFPGCHLLTDTDECLLKSYFEVFLSYIPDNALTLCIPTVTASWLSSVLQFSSAYVPQSEKRLTKMCANSCSKLTSEAVIDFTSRVLVDLNNCVHAIATTSAFRLLSLRGKVKKLSDYYLNYHAERSTISAVQFTEVLQSTLWCSRSSFDSSFEALEKLLQFSETNNSTISQQHLMEIIGIIDFTKLSQDALERASKNDRIPSKVIMEAAVVVCSKLRNELSQQKTNLDAMEQQLSESPKKVSANQRLLSKTQANLKRVELFPHISGTWTSSTPRSQFRRYTFEHLPPLSLCVTQSHDCKENGIIPFTITATLDYSARHYGRSRTRDFNVRPACIVPLTSCDTDVSSLEMWQTWFNKVRTPDSDINIPSFLIYDLNDDLLFSPWPQSHREGEFEALVQWSKS